MTTLLPGEPWFHPDMACLKVDPDLFFSTDRRGIEEAKDVCRGCPVMQRCASRALATGEEHGVWGAMDPDERKELLDQQQRSSTRSRGKGRRRTAGTPSVGSAA